MTSPKNGFQTLLDELDVFKADSVDKTKQDDAAIAAAAADGDASGDGDADDKTKKDEDALEAGEAGADKGEIKKAIQVTLADGTVVDATDGTELVKSLTDRLDGMETMSSKALRGVIDLVKAQSASITKLTETLTALASQGKGRKAVLTIHDKTAVDLAKAEETAGLTPNEFMAKADQAWRANKISGDDLARLETYMNKGLQPPENLKNVVLS